MIPPRDLLAVTAVNGRLYAIGGRHDGSYAANLAVNEAYDPATDHWEARASMPLRGRKSAKDTQQGERRDRRGPGFAGVPPKFCKIRHIPSNPLLNER
jgi:hypothetical protein